MNKYESPPSYSSVICQQPNLNNKYVYVKPKHGNTANTRYHGPVVNHQPVHTTKITQVRYNTATNTKTTHISYIKNPQPVYLMPEQNSSCYIKNQDPIPFHLRCPTLGRDTYFEEQKEN